MKLEDIAKMAIDEVAMELKEINEDESKNRLTTLQPTINPSVNDKSDAGISLGGEEIFLRNLKERILVLFEGLNATPKENLEDRLDLTLKFLEFALANVENRLENLKNR